MKNDMATAMMGTFTVVLTAFVIGTLYFAQDFLIPLALAALLAFLLTPLVNRLDRWIGRIGSVLAVVGLIVVLTGLGGWVLAGQIVDLASKLPDYKENIRAKLRVFAVVPGGPMSRFTDAVEELKNELPGGSPRPVDGTNLTPVVSAQTPPPAAPVRVQVVESSRASSAELMKRVMPSVLEPLATLGLVLLLLIFMLLKREDLRSRLIRLIGQGRISATTLALKDAGRRVSRFLFMQLLVNVTYGIPVTIGLYFIGVPNALLWGVMAIVLRFIPYVGPWIAAAIPIALSLTVFDSWTGPLLTIGLFIVLELISNNVMEPWLYGASTGVSSVALIVAAVFWTWLWGPIGLVLATPLTVCLAVMGRHVPRLQFLSVLLSDQEPLTPADEFYQRLLSLDLNEAVNVVEAYIKANSMLSLYDSVIIPVIVAAELDHRRDALEQRPLAALQQSLREIIDDLGTPTSDPARLEGAPPWFQPRLALTGSKCSILCLPARAERDELSGAMLTQLLNQERIDAEFISTALPLADVLDMVEKKSPSAVCIGVVPPSTIIHARYLSTRLRQRFPTLQIVVGLWGVTDNLAQITERLQASGADEVVNSLATAVVLLNKLCGSHTDGMTPAPIPADEELRLAELAQLKVIDTEPEPALDKVAKRLARVFGVPMALVSFIDRERQFFKAQVGLPEDLAMARGMLRAASLCGHVVGNNQKMVVEDLARDPRFASNPFVKERGLRFYAGVPLLSAKGQPVGSLCVMDTKVRQVSDREARLLDITAEELMEEINARVAAPRTASDASMRGLQTVESLDRARKL